MSASRCFEILPQNEMAFSLFSSHGARSKCLCDLSVSLVILRCLVIALLMLFAFLIALWAGRRAGLQEQPCRSSSLPQAQQEGTCQTEPAHHSDLVSPCKITAPGWVVTRAVALLSKRVHYGQITDVAKALLLQILVTNKTEDSNWLWFLCCPWTTFPPWGTFPALSLQWHLSTSLPLISQWLQLCTDLRL